MLPETPPSAQDVPAVTGKPGIFRRRSEALKTLGLAILLGVSAVLIFLLVAWLAYQFSVFVLNSVFDKWPW